ncbi:MAG: histidine--tRNA ligase [Chloroflexi bacterium]|nr:histidine--tRNA ligase [Chloroflexota bacterium]
MTFRAPRGTADILPADQPYWSMIRRTAAGVAAAFGYGRIDTPTFEDTRLFTRGVGEETDVVQKEMYTFEDHGGDPQTLRPEGTASVCRAYLQHGMQNLPQPVRLYYDAPMYRYERPQAGRLRQHHQFGVEAIGDPSPQVDAEVIELGWQYLTSLGLKGLTVKVNSIGDPACRPAYLEELRAYYAGRVQHMCEDCKRRIERSPLRLLDCKKGPCIRQSEEAPRSTEYLCGECRDHWEDVLSHLQALTGPYPDLRYETDHRLVRGLDYYTRTVFEVHPAEEGAQSGVLAGGRYDGLMEQIGGPPTPGIGFGSGIERLILNLKRQGSEECAAPGIDVVAVHVGERARHRAAVLATELRLLGRSVVVAPAGRGVRSQMRYANALSARFALILGDRELERGIAALKPLDGGEQIDVPLDASTVARAVEDK